MKLEEIVSACLKSIRDCKGTPFTPKITLKMPENNKCPRRRKLFGRLGPYGDVVAFGFDGYDTVIFDAKEVLGMCMFIAGQQGADGQNEMERKANERNLFR